MLIVESFPGGLKLQCLERFPGGLRAIQRYDIQTLLHGLMRVVIVEASPGMKHSIVKQ